MIRSGLPVAMVLLVACADAPRPAAVVVAPVSPPIASASAALRVRPGGPVFATGSSGHASLHLPVGGAEGGAVLEVADGALAVRGHVAASDVWQWTSQLPGLSSLSSNVGYDPGPSCTLSVTWPASSSHRSGCDPSRGRLRVIPVIVARAVGSGAAPVLTGLGARRPRLAATGGERARDRAAP